MRYNNALSTWILAVQPRESWYLAGWINDTPIDFLVDPGAVVSAISLQYYEKLVDAGAIHTPLKKMHMELEAANESDMIVHGTCSLELTVHGLVIHMDTVVVDLELSGHTRNGYSRGCHKTAIHSRSCGWNIVRRWLRNHPTPPIPRDNRHCVHPTTLRNNAVGQLKTNNGRRGPTAGVVLALQTFVQEFGILVGRSLVRADAEDWKIPILLYNSDPCTKNSKDCQCNPVIIPARTRIACVEEIQAIQNIGTHETERSAGEGILPPHLIDVLDAASELTSDQRTQPTFY